MLQGKICYRSSFWQLALMTLAFIGATLTPGLARARMASEIKPFFLYRLSNFTGPIPFGTVEVTVDNTRDEAYVCGSGKGVQIFNKNGLEVYRFGYNARLGWVNDLVVLKDGDLLTLAGGRLVLCNYRGQVKKKFTLKDIPGGYFSPTKMVLVNDDRLYLADYGALRVVVTDLQGRFIKQINLAKFLKIDKKDVPNNEMAGFDVGQDGTIYFTIPVLFHAYRLPPGGPLEPFGKAGSAPGHFAITGGIAVGPDGMIYVTYKMKSKVIIYDRDLRFVTEFGGRGQFPDSLAGPTTVTIADDGWLYVSQRNKEGVKVFRILHIKRSVTKTAH